jgi:hypothetical protein
MAAPEGNNFSSKDNRLWANTLRRVAVQGNGERLRRLAERLFDQAEEGNVAAIKEIGDRLDGKALMTLAGDPENPLTIALIERKIVK